MKRFWLVLLSLGLIVAFSTSAMAVDLKFSGEYYAAGMYLDNVNMNKTGYATYTTKPTGAVPPYAWVYNAAGVPANETSTAFFYQRLRLTTTFIVHPGLFFATRADIMERAWGAPRSSARVATVGAAGTVLGYTDAPLADRSAGTRAENENIAFDLAYLTYISPIGIFMAGYQIDGAWGTTFGDTSTPLGRIGYILPIKGFQIAVMAGKNNGGELSHTAINESIAADRDSSFYTAFVKYNWKGGEAALLGKYIRNASNRDVLGGLAAINPLLDDVGYTQKVFVVVPYAKVQLGPVAIQAEVDYAWGSVDWEGWSHLLPAPPGGAVWGSPGPQQDSKISSLGVYLDATADFGIAYFGGSAAYISGDDPSSTDKMEGGVITGGLDWNPCLIMFNSDLAYWAGVQPGYGYGFTGASTANGAGMSNAYFAQLRAGVRPIDKLDIMASVSYAKADKTPHAWWVDREYGWEVDVTATYKITNNLSYMLGAGYFIVGDYYKGSGYNGVAAAQPGVLVPNDLEDNFMVINKLTLTF